MLKVYGKAIKNPIVGAGMELVTVDEAGKILSHGKGWDNMVAAIFDVDWRPSLVGDAFEALTGDWHEMTGSDLEMGLWWIPYGTE